MRANPFFSTYRIAAIITIIATIGVLGFLIYPNFFKNRLDYEVFKYSFQFLLLVVIGGAVTLVFTNYTKSKEERMKQNEKKEQNRNEKKIIQHNFHNNFVQSFNSVKLIRRMIRARACILYNDGEIVLKTKEYDRQMQELTKLQLQFEFYIDEAKSNPNLFESNEKGRELQTKIKQMEVYLNKIVIEYEECFKHFPDKYYIDDIPTLSVNKLPILADFILKYENAKDFKEKFREPANDVQSILLGMINLD